MFDYSKDLLTNMEDRDRHHDFIEETAHIKRISSSIATMARNSSIDTLDSISRQLNQARETLNIGAAAIKNSLLDSGSTANENNPENNPDTLNEQQDKKAVAQTPTSRQNVTLGEGVFYIFWGREDFKLAIDAEFQTWHCTTTIALAQQRSRRIRTALKFKRKEEDPWDPEDKGMWDYQSSKTPKSFAGKPFGGVILYWDSYIAWCIVKRYKPDVVARLETVDSYQHWRALDVWTRYINQAQSGDPNEGVDNFGVKAIPFALRQVVLDVGDLLEVEDEFMKKLWEGEKMR